MKKTLLSVSTLAGLTLFSGVALGTPLSGMWGDDVAVDVDTLTININPEHSFRQSADYHGGWFLLDSAAESISISANWDTFDAEEWDKAYWGITQVGSSIMDFTADADNTFGGAIWSNMSVEKSKSIITYISGVDYDPTKDLWGYAFWDTKYQKYSDEGWGSWGKVTFSEGAAPVPEPATMLLFGTGLLGVVGISKRKKSKKV